MIQSSAACRLQVALLGEGISVGRRRVRRLMRKLGLWAVRPKRNTSKRHPKHKVYPYLLRGKTIDQANRVWAADITYIAMRQGFLYLVAIIDWATRRVLSWRLSNTLTAGFCVEALGKALARFGTPGIFQTTGTVAVLDIALPFSISHAPVATLRTLRQPTVVLATIAIRHLSISALFVAAELSKFE